MGDRAREKKKGVLHYLGVGVSIAALGLVLLIGVLAVGLPAATGSTPMTILTGSMEPKLPPGTLVIIKPTPVDDIGIGDVITYQLESGKAAVVTHRVVGIEQSDAGELRFITKGDANEVPDPVSVMPVQVRGTLWYAIPYLGWANTIVNGENRGWIVYGLVGLLFAYAGFMFTSGVVGRVRAKRRREDRELAREVERMEQAMRVYQPTGS